MPFCCSWALLWQLGGNILCCWGDMGEAVPGMDGGGLHLFRRRKWTHHLHFQKYVTLLPLLVSYYSGLCCCLICIIALNNPPSMKPEQPALTYTFYATVLALRTRKVKWIVAETQQYLNKSLAHNGLTLRHRYTHLHLQNLKAKYSSQFAGRYYWTLE